MFGEDRTQLREAEAIDREEDRRYANRADHELPPELADARRRLEVISKAKAAPEEEARRRAQAADHRSTRPITRTGC